MNYLYRKIRSIFYLLLNIVIFLLLFPFKKESNLKINSQLKRDEVINYLLNKKFQKNGKYLEIGCDLNQTFSKIDNNNKTGIDPVRGGNLKLSSKEFFENYNKEFFDVVFIDGSHLIEDVYYDTIQAIKNLNLGGYILLDDVLPNNNLNTFRKRMTLHSFQDAYKILFFVSSLSFVDLYLLPSDHGMALIKLTDDPIVKELEFDFSDINFDNYIEFLKNNNFVKIDKIDDLSVIS